MYVYAHCEEQSSVTLFDLLSTCLVNFICTDLYDLHSLTGLYKPTWTMVPRWGKLSCSNEPRISGRVLCAPNRFIIIKINHRRFINLNQRVILTEKLQFWFYLLWSLLILPFQEVCNRTSTGFYYYYYYNYFAVYQHLLIHN